MPCVQAAAALLYASEAIHSETIMEETTVYRKTEGQATIVHSDLSLSEKPRESSKFREEPEEEDKLSKVNGEPRVMRNTSDFERVAGYQGNTSKNLREGTLETCCRPADDGACERVLDYDNSNIQSLWYV